MHEDEGLDCKVLYVGICPLALLGFEKPGLFMVK